MDKSLIPSKRLVAVFAVLAAISEAPHAQVIERYQLMPAIESHPWGRRPYEFSPYEKKGLVAIATRAASPGAALFNIDAYYVCSERSSKCREVPRADMLFGPYDRSDNTFSLDAITCIWGEYRKNAWGCKPKESWTYLLLEGAKSIVAFETGVSLEAARQIAAYEDGNPYCRPSAVKDEGSAGRDAILSANRISLDNATGNYRLGDSCWRILRITDAKIELIDQGLREILY